ncbi:MAG: ATP synthase F1 subunit delta [Fulvivirga sp.]|nr:ATP synthase F1 subunit delta [Fulvivirga sp.]
MSDYRVTSRYAKSLLELAEEQNALEEVLGDMKLFAKVCKESRDLVLVLKNPIIKHDKKNAILREIFEGKVHNLTLSIFDISTRKNREALLPEMAKEFQKQYNLFKGIEEAKVTTAVPLSDDLRKELEAIVKKISSKSEVEFSEATDEGIIGGYILKVGDRQIDDSIKSKIKALELKLSDKKSYIKGI